MPEPTVLVTYELRCPAAEARQLAEAVALELTLEVPMDLVERCGKEDLLGEVRELTTNESGVHQARIAFDADLTCGQLPQLLNLISGNISFLDGVRVMEIDLPESVLRSLPGPNHGIPGLRERLGVEQRPLIATALKPRGLPNDEYAQLAHDFVLGGGDIVKDDHNLVSPTFDAFRERVCRCQEAVQRANAKAGSSALYLPHLCLPLELHDQALELFMAEGIDGALVAPGLIGFEVTRSIASRTDLVLMGHPSLSGSYYIGSTHGFDHGLIMGLLFRWIGCDATVFVNHGGRFHLTRDECGRIVEALRKPLPGMLPSFPTPAGGMCFENIETMIEDYGRDSIFLIGGALLLDGDDLKHSTRRFRERVESHFPATARPFTPR